MSRKAVFLDRDGVLIEDVGPLVQFEQVNILPGVVRALTDLRSHGYLLVVISNQTVIARGRLTVSEVDSLHDRLNLRFRDLGASIDRFYYCPHHPNATMPEFRIACSCRKPLPGMLLEAGSDLDIELGRSFMVGDRLSDVVAGHRAGVKTIQIQSGRHDDPPIESGDWPNDMPDPDFRFASLGDAAEFILTTGS